MLQALRACIADGPCEHAMLILPYWSFVVPRLVLDANRSVRLESVRVMGVLAGAAGRQLAPQLGNIMGPWLLSQSDESLEVARAARETLASTFPGPKRDLAIKHCWQPVCMLLALARWAECQMELVVLARGLWVLPVGTSMPAQKVEWGTSCKHEDQLSCSKPRMFSGQGFSRDGPSKLRAISR